MFYVLGSLYEEAALRGRMLKSSAESRLQELPDVSEYWIRHESMDDSLSTAAAEGGSGFKEFSGLILAAINTAVLSDSGEIVEGSFLDILGPQSGIRERVRNLTAICEFKNSIIAMEDLQPDLLILDGSLIGTILRPVKYDGVLGNDVKGWIRSHCLREVAASMDGVHVHSRSMEDTIRDALRSERPVVYLEGIERMVSIWKLLKKTRDIVAVSERSTMSDIFGDMSDLSVFNTLTAGPGHSVPVHRELSGLKGRFPVLDAFFSSLEFTVFYARLEENGRVLKFEVPRRLGTAEIGEYLEGLRASSADGYPHILRRVKEDVRITAPEMDIIAGMVLEGLI